MAIVAGAVVAPVIGAGLEQMHFPGPAASVFLGPVKSALLGAFLGFTQVGLWALLAVVPRRERELLERELTVRRLEAESQQLRTMAELSELRSRLEPHFLLNTLNTAAAIVVRAPEDARDLLTALGELLSDSLLDQGPSRSLREEIEWTRRYLHILERRHSDRLRVRFALDETAMGLQVPSMMLQPLVENAVEHGVLCQREPSTVEISTHLDAGRLRCTIRNATAPRTAANGRGVGLTSLARRLSLFSSPATFQLNRGDSLTEAIVEIDYGVVRA
jgi:LytS/YehU family sensor histidine kinase